KNVRAIVQATLDKMDLVTREEMEIQEKVLARTRERLEALEARLTELEQEQEQGPD
ncbi:MAG: accessory factor UbiK family protein, partial [Arenicellales bacterium]|nr:accessory factor UbiK family protein [Arenicellales bacterium]